VDSASQAPVEGAAAGATANRGFPFGAGAKDPLVRGTLAEQDSLWRAMTSKEADDFYEGGIDRLLARHPFARVGDRYSRTLPKSFPSLRVELLRQVLST